MDFITEGWGVYVAIFLAVLGLGSAVARVTPNKADNAFFDAIWKIVNKLGLRGGPTD